MKIKSYIYKEACKEYYRIFEMIYDTKAVLEPMKYPRWCFCVTKINSILSF